MRAIGRVIVALLGFAAASASASLWRMTEIYSNADGSVQYLEFYSDFPGQEALSGHTLTSSTGLYYTFPNDLLGETTGKTMLVGTEAFATLAIVPPDYVVPNGFFSSTGGTVDFNGGFDGFDTWVYPALPTRGQELGRQGVVAVNSPMNFAGVTGTVPIGRFNFQALWYASPAESEAGWGLNVTHQGDTLFATWFTYDLDGSAMWLVAPNTQRTVGDTYSGKLYRTTGPAFSSVPFSPAGVGVTEVGSTTLSLASAGSGTFSYTVYGISQSKAITRQVFDAISVCSESGTAGRVPNYQDLWWASPAGSESGWGVNLTHQGDTLFATWFTYDAAGKGIWIVMPAGRLAGGAYSGKLYRTTGAPFNAVPWSPSSTTVTEVGSGSFTFSGTNAGTFAYTVSGISQSKAIVRQVYAVPATVCRQLSPAP